MERRDVFRENCFIASYETTRDEENVMVINILPRLSKTFAWSNEVYLYSVPNKVVSLKAPANLGSS